MRTLRTLLISVIALSLVGGPLVLAQQPDKQHRQRQQQSQQRQHQDQQTRERQRQRGARERQRQDQQARERQRQREAQERQRQDARQDARRERRWDRAADRHWYEDRWRHRARHYDRHVYRRAYVSPRRYHYSIAYDRPPGWYYRRWNVGLVFPGAFWTPNYFISSWSLYGLLAPPWGYEWVRYGNDAVLVDVRTGAILQVRYNVFW